MSRIAFVLPNMAGGGAERVALTLIDSFIERGHAIDLVLMEAKGDLMEVVPAGVRIVDLKARRTRHALRPLVRYLRETRPDAVQVSMWPLTVVALLARAFSRVQMRMVVSDHISLSQQYGESAGALAAIKATTRLAYPLADARVCVSEGSAKDLARLSGMPSERISVVYNPIPAPSSVQPSLETAEADSLWGNASPRILTVGSMKAQKNQALLIEAFARLNSHPDARLMILGEGDLRPSLERKAKASGVAGRVIFPGFRVDSWPYYATADLFVLSSDYEGFGNVLVEAMHAGLPIVSTDCPDGPGEILGGGKFGTLVPVGDAEALSSAMSEALRVPGDPEKQKARALDFTPDIAAERYLALLFPGTGK